MKVVVSEGRGTFAARKPAWLLAGRAGRPSLTTTAGYTEAAAEAARPCPRTRSCSHSRHRDHPLHAVCAGLDRRPTRGPQPAPEAPAEAIGGAALGPLTVRRVRPLARIQERRGCGEPVRDPGAARVGELRRLRMAGRCEPGAAGLDRVSDVPCRGDQPWRPYDGCAGGAATDGRDPRTVQGRVVTGYRIGDTNSNYSYRRATTSYNVLDTAVCHHVIQTFSPWGARNEALCEQRARDLAYRLNVEYAETAAA